MARVQRERERERERVIGHFVHLFDLFKLRDN